MSVRKNERSAKTKLGWDEEGRTVNVAGRALLVVEIEERFLHSTSEPVRRSESEKQKRWLVPVEMTVKLRRNCAQCFSGGAVRSAGRVSGLDGG